MPVYFVKKQVSFSGPAKPSAKGVTRDARRSMTHELYKRTLLGGEVVSILNTQIASSNHRLHTIVVNKKSLSGYDDKRFIMNDQVSTLPYEHQCLRDDMFFRTIVNDPDWGSEDEKPKKSSSKKLSRKTSTSRKIPQLNSTKTSSKNSNSNNNNNNNNQALHKPAAYTTQASILFPTQVFISENIARTKLNENLVDFDKLSDLSDSGSSTHPASDGFILDQAVESDTASVSSDIHVSLASTESKKRKKKAGKGAAKKPRARIIDYSSTDED